MARNEALNQAMRAESRRAILAAAVRLFARRGYAGGSIRALATEAKISLGLLYNYFPSKQAVLEALMAESFAEVQATFTVAERGRSARDYVSALLAAAVSAVHLRADAWRVSYALRHQPEVADGIGKSLVRVQRAIVVGLADALARRGVAEPETEAALLFAIVDGVCQAALLGGSKFPVAAVIAAAAHKYPGGRR